MFALACSTAQHMSHVTLEIYDHKKGNGHSLTSEVQCEDMMADLYQESPGPNKPFNV